MARPSIFARIVAGALPASFVYQDQCCVAFLDINPITHGHALVVPRLAVATLDELDEATRQHLWRVAQQIAAAQRKALGSRAQNLLVNDGRVAGQSVPHVHLHVIPRYGDDRLRTALRVIWHLATLTLPRAETKARRAKLNAVASAIRAALPG